MTGTRKDVARLLLLSERRVTELTQTGVLPKPEGKRAYDLTACTQGYITFLRTKPGAVTEHRARLLGAQATLAELNLKTRQGELVERRVIDDQAFRQAREVRDQLGNIPDRISGIVAAETDQAKVHAILTKEIQQCLEALTDEHKPDPSPNRDPDAARPRPAPRRDSSHAARPRGSA